MWFADLNTDDLSKEQLIEARKMLGQFIKQSKSEAKHKECLICGKKAPFCNSHTIPQFCLKNIADNGKMKSFNALVGTELLSAESGVNNAGTFHIICRSCDGTIFQDYEDPQAYAITPSSKLLNQIALKNALRDINKHETEIEMMKSMKKMLHEKDLFGVYEKDSYFECQITARSRDVEECYDIFNDAKTNLTSANSNYHLISFDQLGYVVPIAFQGMIALITGVNGEVINDQYNYDSNYSLEYLHLAVFPLENTSVIISFSDDKYTRITTFENELK